MKGCDFMAYKNTVDMLLKSYSDNSFEKIVKAIDCINGKNLV